MLAARQENRIVFPSDFFVKEVRPTYNIIKELIEFRGYETVILDLSRVVACFADAFLPIVSTAVKYQSELVRFEIIPPTLPSLQKTFASANWLHLICPRQFPTTDDVRKDVFPARVFRDPKDQQNVVASIVERILTTTVWLERSHLRALEWAINEITDNVITHSGDECFGIIQLANKRLKREIEFVVSDCGLGIPTTLRSQFPSWNDEKCLEESVNEGVTRGTGQGNGLFGSIRIAESSGGAFSINSGQAHLSLSRPGAGARLRVRREELTFPGTSIDFHISYNTPLVLENALRFKGRSHQPNDTIDYKYGDSDNELLIDIAEEAESVGSRPAGRLLRTKVENIRRMSEIRPIILDCSGCSLFSSSFADELFSKLIETLGVDIFVQDFIVADASDININIIDRSTIQRCGISFVDVLAGIRRLRRQVSPPVTP